MKTMREGFRTLARKRARAVAAVAAALLTGSCGGDDSTAPAADIVDVYTPGAVFTPFTAEVGVGGTVRFHMMRSADGDGHNAIFNKTPSGAPADVNIVVDSTVSRVFTTRGTFGYYCTVHPGMTGEVVVH